MARPFTPPPLLLMARPLREELFLWLPIGKKTVFLRRHVPYQGWGNPLSLKKIKIDFFQTKCKIYSSCPEKNPVLLTFCLYCHPLV